MAQTKIEWTATPRADGSVAPGYTFNPWIGCEKVSPGCAHCYAEALMDTQYHKVKWGKDGTRVRTTPEYWRQPLKWNRAAKAAGERRKVFCASLADILENRPDLADWRAEACALMEATPNLTWLLLTKRPQHAWLLPDRWFSKWPQNVWIGATVELQKFLAQRVNALAQCPAPVRFLSCEPLLGPLAIPLASLSRLRWIIVGGESGNDARPFRVNWAQDLRDQCREAGVACFIKQLGARPEFDSGCEEFGRLERVAMDLRDKKGGDWSEWPEDLRVREWPDVERSATV